MVCRAYHTSNTIQVGLSTNTYAHQGKRVSFHTRIQGRVTPVSWLKLSFLIKIGSRGKAAKNVESGHQYTKIPTIRVIANSEMHKIGDIRHDPETTICFPIFDTIFFRNIYISNLYIYICRFYLHTTRF